MKLNRHANTKPETLWGDIALAPRNGTTFEARAQDCLGVYRLPFLIFWDKAKQDFVHAVTGDAIQVKLHSFKYS